jgi:hypothetical protein
VVATQPDGALGVPAPRIEGFTIRLPLAILIVGLAIFLPVLGASLLGALVQYALGSARRRLAAIHFNIDCAYGRHLPTTYTGMGSAFR